MRPHFLMYLSLFSLVSSCSLGPEKLAPGTAVFDWFEYTGRDAWFEQPVEPGSVRNPILAGFYPDPGIVRATARS